MFFTNQQNIEENNISFYESINYDSEILDLKDSSFNKVKFIKIDSYPNNYLDFTCFPNLEKISISYCRAKHFKLKHHKIVSLNIHKGVISTIDIDIPSLESIIIQNNFIKSITSKNLKSNNLTSVNFNNNYLKTFNLNMNFIKDLRLPKNLLSELSIQSFSLNKIILRNNNLKSIQLSTPNLMYLNLTDNKIENFFIKNANYLTSLVADDGIKFKNKNMYNLFKEFELNPVLIQVTSLTDEIF